MSTLLMMQEIRLAQEVDLFEKWLALLDSNLVGMIKALHVLPEPRTPPNVLALRGEIRSVFFTIIGSLGVERMDVFKTLGSPLMLRHFVGHTAKPLSGADWDMELYHETYGNRPVPTATGRIKPVIEPATGMSWPSAKALAEELECAPISVYVHLGESKAMRTLKGRQFEYMVIEEVKDPRLPVNWSDEEKERQREEARKLGFEVQF